MPAGETMARHIGARGRNVIRNSRAWPKDISGPNWSTGANWNCSAGNGSISNRAGLMKLHTPMTRCERTRWQHDTGRDYRPGTEHGSGHSSAPLAFARRAFARTVHTGIEGREHPKGLPKRLAPLLRVV